MAAIVRSRWAIQLIVHDTIVALSSGRPPAALAVLRVSGPVAMAAVAALAGPLPEPRRAGVRTLRAAGEALDRALVLVFPAPASATGEDLVELHCHGGRAVVEAVERAVMAQPGVRRAEPGEFTRRALIHGRLDLAEAEGLADLLAAETESQRRAAWSAAGGVISGAVRGWMDRLADLSAEVEARIDHDEDGDVPAEAAALRPAMLALVTEIRAAVAGPAVERLRDGVRVVIAGPPNAGKSTLLNALAAREAAIVSPIAGTTRDRIEVPVTRDGMAYVLTDTAGLTDTDDPIEAIGVARAHEAVAAADLVLWVSDAPAPARAILVYAKADLADRAGAPAEAVAVSALTRRGLDELWDAIATRAAAMTPARDTLAFTRRQHALVAGAGDELGLALAQSDWLLVAEHCRRARHRLGELLGIDATEAMLDALFARFCLGK